MFQKKWKPTASWTGNTGLDQDGNKTRVYWFKNEKGDMRLLEGRQKRELSRRKDSTKDNVIVVSNVHKHKQECGWNADSCKHRLTTYSVSFKISSSLSWMPHPLCSSIYQTVSPFIPLLLPSMHPVTCAGQVACIVSASMMLQLFAVPKVWHGKFPFLGTFCRMHIAHSIRVRSGWKLAY